MVESPRLVILMDPYKLDEAIKLRKDMHKQSKISKLCMHALPERQKQGLFSRCLIQCLALKAGRHCHVGNWKEAA